MNSTGKSKRNAKKKKQSLCSRKKRENKHTWKKERKKEGHEPRSSANITKSQGGKERTETAAKG